MSIFVLTTTLGLTACGLGRSASNKTTSVPAETRIAAYKLGTADVGYQAALGYPGSLTDFSGTLQSGMTYKFMNFPNGLYVPAGVNNVTFFGCRFASNALSDANVAVYGDNIVFDYDSFVPSKVSAPPATYNQGYQYGIDVRGSVQVTVNHSDFWGWGNGIQFGFSSQAKPFVVKNSYFHDARGDGGIDHTDAILENYGGQSYMVFDNNKIVSAGNTNGLALQNGNKGGYQNVTITNNYFSGFGYTLNLCGYFNGCSNINFSGNTYGTDIKPVWGPLYSWSNGNGNIWRCNKWRVAPGGYSSKTEDDGKYWLSSGNLSATDSGGGSCADSGGVPTPAPTPEPTPTPAPAPAPIPTPAPSATQSILSKQLPSGKKSSDGANVNYELGMKFSADIDGRITAVRFYKSSSESGIHTGRIYSSSGSLLASVQFRNESASGWQVQNLSSPLSIAAHTAYVVSVNTGNSYYVDTVSGFASKIVSGNLSANVGAGVYGPVGSMPSRVYQNSNYFRDVVFVPGASAPSPAPAPIPTPAPTPAPQPGPSPNPAPPAGVKNCALNPSSCGYPDDTNTGIQSGVTLKRIPQDVSSGAGWHYDSRGWISIDTDGAVFNGYSVDTNIDVTANNVTVSNVRSTAGGESFGISLRHTQNVTIRNCEIAPRDMTGPNRLLVAIKDIYGDATGTQILKNNIYHASTGIQVYSGLVQDNYVHDMGFNAGDHVNGLTVNSGTTLMTIQHNTIFNQLSQTDAISLFQDFGVETNKIIDNNLVAGGGYTIYAGSGTKGATSNIRVTNNRISRIYFPNGGDFGPATAYEPGGSGNVWSGNVWDDTNAAVSQP